MIKPGVESIFKQYPELQSVGTPEQYSKYLDTIFPTSKVKDIVYHGSLEERTSWKQNQHFGTLEAAHSRVEFIKQVKAAFDKKGIFYPAVLNISNIQRTEDADYNWNTVIDNAKKQGFNGLVYQNNNEGKNADSFVVFEPEQIHILGSKQDIDGFKKFVFKEKNMAETFSKDWWSSILSQLDESKASTESSPYHQLVLNNMDEIERTSEEFNAPLEDLRYAFEAGQEVILSDDIWSKLENTDSYKIKNLEQAVKLAEKYKKDWKSVVNAIKEEKQLPLPMVLNWAENKYYLVDGNTRLMIYKALGVTPVVLMGKLDLNIQEGSAVFDVDTIKLDNKQKNTINKFLKFAIKVLELQNIPQLVLSYNNDHAKENHTFGYFNPENNKIWLYVKNRNMADILRTLAHELVHRRQAELGLLDNESGETGSPIENAANAAAGVLLRQFGKDNNQIFESLNINEWKIATFSFEDFIKNNYIKLLKKLNSEGIDLMDRADIDINNPLVDIVGLSMDDISPFNNLLIQQIKKKLGEEITIIGFNSNFNKESIVGVSIQPKGEAECRGISFTIMPPEIMDLFLSGHNFSILKGITFKGLPIYYDFIWC